ncbi:TonB family protein [Pseudobdellovibrio sp. HCB154]|uniref:energy transducer TonB n=1 Tax=Pseudobdellovibrio sp. HCB154 TaxID=3386277 RepID=UPI003916E5EF
MSSGVYDYYFEDSASYRNRDSSKYFGMSVIIHAALAIGALFVTVPVMEKLKSEPILVEFEAVQELPPMPVKPIQPEIAKGENVKPTRGGKTAHAPAPAAPLDAKEDVVVKGPAKTSKVSKSKIATVKTKTSGGAAKTATYAPSRSGVPETLEDIPAPKLDFDGVEAAQVGKMGDDELESEFKNIDHANEAAIRAEKARMDDQAREIGDQSDESLKALENKFAAESRLANDELMATRTKNAAAVARLKASENAAAAERAAREKAEALAAASRGRGTGDAGVGRGSSGSNETAKAAAGAPTGVRSIDQLRQIPGNPKPSYSVEERLNRQQGRVTFQAYVTKEGGLINFRLLTSTGYKNLDGKTLAALKKWRFYPGQQGWVEIPQVWTLKGDVQQMPATLRRRAALR